MVATHYWPLLVGAMAALITGCASMAPSPPGANVSALGGQLVTTEHTSANGTYQTSFEIPIPAAVAAPRLSLNYDSGASGSLAGFGWDLTVGWPMSITRDVRFGTPQWTLDADWLWGSTSLVRMNPKEADCAAKGWCKYRLAPDALVEVAIFLTAGPERARGATVRLPSGTTLEYEAVIYDDKRYPPPPAGFQTPVFGFRLASVIDRNGYRVCFKHVDTDKPNTRGEVARLEEIYFGLTPSQTAKCSDLFAEPSLRRNLHRVVFKYDRLADAGYFTSWTLRFGAPASFNHLLTRIAVYANGAPEPQDEFLLNYQTAQTTETRRPLLKSIVQQVPVLSIVSRHPPETTQKVVRTFAYGGRNPAYGPPEVIDIGDFGSFPPSLAGVVTRPIRRASIFDNPLGLFQAGQDQDTDAAPLTHATTEQWAFMDINGDGLPDFQWGKETGTDPADQWPTFERGPLEQAVDRRARPAQQKIMINHGISNSRLATSFTSINSRAASLETDYAIVPTIRNEIPTRAFTSWIWGEGWGQTRTGMPVSISAPEIANQVGSCPRGKGQDPRRWPKYPDGTFAVSKGSVGAALAQLSLLGPADGHYPGDPAIEIIKGIHDGYRPTHAVSATVSGWADMNGDGIPEFIATPGWIERFSLPHNCQPFVDPAELLLQAIEHTLDAEFANEPSAATDSAGAIDTRWHFNKSLALPSDGTTVNLDLEASAGPAGPVGLPLSYDTTTSTSEGRGFTVPIGSLVSTGIATILTPGPKWIPIAAAAPGLTIDSASPRSVGGYVLSIPAPSATAVLQGLGNVAQSGADPSSIAGFIMSLVRINFDFTILSTTSRSRSENRAQLMDINGDGLPDYLLYNSSGSIPIRSQPTGFAPPGSLLVYLNSPGGFDPKREPVVINSGFAYPTPPPSIDQLDLRVEDIKGHVKQLTDPLLGFPEERCVPLASACLDYIAYLFAIADKATEILDDPETVAFMALTTDATPAERSQFDEMKELRNAVKGLAIYFSVQAGQQLLALPALPQTPLEVSTATASARTLSEIAGQFVLTIRHIGYASRINVVNQGFSMLGGQQPADTADAPDYYQPAWQPADGIAVQTRGFVDLNGDGLPDYVNTNERETNCGPNQWQVIWGTGTSSLTEGRAFLREIDKAGALVPTCLTVPQPPDEIVKSGYRTLPMNVDRVRRAATTNASEVSTIIHSFVSLNDINRDGRPDIVIAGEKWDPDATSQTWHVFLNTGSGFETTPSLNIASPQGGNINIETADCRTYPSQSCAGLPLDVPYPAIRTTHATGNLLRSRDTTQTEAAMIDIDGDGFPEIVRRIHTIERVGNLPPRPTREGLLVWRRANIGGPQDLMIEERFPIEGGRTLVEYRSATDFQWTDAKPDGQAPRLGHRPVGGVARDLVRSVTTERMIGKLQGCTRQGYDYKMPYFDMASRNSTGFALRSSYAMEPCPSAAKDAVAIGDSVVQTQRSAQRPNGVPSVTHTRTFVQSSGAPVSEALTSYTESDALTRCAGVGSTPNSDPAAACPRVGGVEVIFSAPTRNLMVEYPSSIQHGAIFDVGFDGREPLMDRATGRGPKGSDVQEFLPQAATGGSMRLPKSALGLSYASPHSTSLGSSNSKIEEATIEAWLKPGNTQDDETVAEQLGGYRLAIFNVDGANHWRLDVNGTPGVTSGGEGDVAADRWHHVVATFGPVGGKIFVNGRIVGYAEWAAPAAAAIASGEFLVACSAPVSGSRSQCFRGEIGELRVYPEFWSTAPRVTDAETELSLPSGCVFDSISAGMQCPNNFGQPLRVFNRNDMANSEDDVATEFEYAAPVPSPPGKTLLQSMGTSRRKRCELSMLTAALATI